MQILARLGAGRTHAGKETQMSMNPIPTSGEMLGLVMTTTMHAMKARQRQSQDTGIRLLASLPRLTGLGDRLRIELSTTPAGDLKITTRTDGRYGWHEVSRQPSWQQIEKLYRGMEEAIAEQVVAIKANDHRDATGISPAWNYKGDVMMRGMIRAAGMTAQEYHDWITADIRADGFGSSLSSGKAPSSPLLKNYGNVLQDRPGAPVHQIRTRLASRRYNLDYYCLSDDVWWTNGLAGNRTGLVLGNRTFPETVRQSMAGCPLREIIAHEALTDERLVIAAVQRRGRATVLRVDTVVDWLDDHPAEVKETLDGIRSGIQILLDHHRPDWAKDADR